MALSTISGTTGITDATITSAKLADFAAAVDLNGVELLLDADQDTSITADTDDRIDFKIAGVEHFSFSNSSGDTILKPMVDAKDIVFHQFDGNKLFCIDDGNFVSVGGNATAPGEIRIYEDTDNGSHYTGFKAGNNTASVAYVLPTADGTDGFQLTTDGSGTLSWSSAGTTLANDGNNRVVTGTGSGLNGEANLTFDGSTLAVTGAITGSSDLTLQDDLILDSDAAVLSFGEDNEITITHVADTGLNIKHTATGDDKPIVLTLQTGETDIAANDVIGTINFQAPDEGTGTDAILVAAGISAISEGDFSSSANATKLSFKTATSAAAAETMSLTSNGDLFIAGGLIDLKNDGNAVSQIKFYCESSNAHAQTLIGAPHSESADNVLTLPGTGGSARLVSTASTATLTNKTLTSPIINTGTFGTSILPTSADGTTLGSASKEFSDLFLADSSTIQFGNDQDTTLTHTDGAGLTLNSTNKLMFNDASQFIQGASATVLDIAATDEIELTATLIDVVGNLAGSGTGTFGGILKTDDATDATSTTDGSLQTDGGLSVAKDIVAGDDIKLLSDAGVIHFGADSEITLTHDADVGLKLKHTATADDKPIILTLQTGETDIAANDVIGRIAFQAPDEGTGTDAILVAAAIQATSEGDFAADNNATKLEFMTGASESATTQMTISSGGIVGIGAGVPGDLGVGLHIKSGDSGSGVSANADELVIEGSGTDIGMSILTPTNGAGRINFSDSGGNDRGQLRYGHDTDGMFMRAGGNDVQKWTTDTVTINEDSDDVDFRVETGANTHTLFIDGGTDKVMINETVADFNIDAGGLCLNQASGDNALISFKSSDVAHGTTGSAETDTYALFKKNDAATGGLMIHCFSENDTTIKFRGYPTNDNTTQSASGSANFVFDSRKKSGTSAGPHGANANLFCIQNDGNTRFIVDEDGDILHDGAISAYDSYDDAHLVRAMDLRRADPATIINSKWDKFVQYNYDDLKKTGILGHLSAKEEAEGQKPFIKMGALQRLHNGAIWQQYEKHNQLLDAVYELAKEAVGEEKANAILDKHEVKRLN
jgi:hypothetical protein